jgi:signal transduction histidine kinase
MRFRKARTRIAAYGALLSFVFLASLALLTRFTIRQTTYADVDDGLDTLAVALASDIELRGLEGVEEMTLPKSVNANILEFHLEHHSAVLLGDRGVIAQTPDLPPIPKGRHLDSLTRRTEKAFTGVEPFSGRNRDARLLVLHLGGRAKGVILVVFRLVGPIERNLGRLDLALAFVVLAGSAGSAAILYLAVGRALQPVDAVIGVAERTQATNLSARVSSPSAGEEFARLVNVINSLLERLERAFEGQRRLVADAAHELKTPVAVIAAEAQAALRDAEGRPESLNAIVLTARALAREVDDLLFLARGELVMRESLEPVDLGDICARAISTVASLASAHGIAVELRRETEALVQGNADALSHLAVNLVKNAILYSPGSSTVEVAVRSADGRASIEVRDRGPGIPAAENVQIFDRFVRLPGGRKVNPEGSGLGLAIVRQVAEAHGGVASVDARAGGGSIFRVELPAAVS